MIAISKEVAFNILSKMVSNITWRPIELNLWSVMSPYTPNSSNYILIWMIIFLNIIINPLWCFNVGRLLICCFIYFVLPENARRHFVAIHLVLWIYFSYFDQIITDIFSIFTKITYLWHTRKVTAIYFWYKQSTKHAKIGNNTFLLWNTSP